MHKITLWSVSHVVGFIHCCFLGGEQQNKEASATGQQGEEASKWFLPNKSDIIKQLNMDLDAGEVFYYHPLHKPMGESKAFPWSSY